MGLDWEDHVHTDPNLIRPAEVDYDYLVGDPRKAKTKLGWQPRVAFEELIRMMVDHDLRLNQKPSDSQ